MKSTYIFKRQTFLLLILITTFVACKKSFLEIVPKGKLIAQTTAQYQGLLASTELVYTVTSAGLPQVVMGDDVAGMEPYFSTAQVRSQRLFQWNDVIYEPGETAVEFSNLMSNIYTYNKVINEVMGSVDGNEQEKKSVRAQAMVARAWSYFILINYYGKPYTLATAATDPGFPIVTVADATETKFTRASVKEVYDFIEKDLITALPDLPTQITHRFKMSKAAAEGVLGKVYVFMGKFEEASSLLNSAITDLGSATVPVGLYDYNVTLGPGGSFLPITIIGVNYPSAELDIQNVFARHFSNPWNLPNNEIVADAKTIRLFGSSDLRLQLFSSSPFPSGNPLPAGFLRRTGPQYAPYGILVPDLFLLRAECRARLNDLAGAKADVEALRAKRMPTDIAVPVNIASDKVSLVKFILEERIREFAVQGFRWFDMRRLSVDPVYNNTVDYSHRVYNAAGALTATYTLRPERLTMRIPQKVIDSNPGMQNNP